VQNRAYSGKSHLVQATGTVTQNLMVQGKEPGSADRQLSQLAPSEQQVGAAVPHERNWARHALPQSACSPVIWSLKTLQLAAPHASLGLNRKRAGIY